MPPLSHHPLNRAVMTRLIPSSPDPVATVGATHESALFVRARQAFVLLRQYGKLHADKKQISVGIIGYPNVGKSSVINTLKSKKVCNVAPIPGETKIWQYITLFRRIFLIDSTQPDAPSVPNGQQARL